MAFGKNLLSQLTGKHRFPPGPKGDLVLGVLRQMQKDPAGFLLESAREFSGICHLRFVHINAFLLDDPAHIAHVTQINASNYVKSPIYHVGRDVTGDGIFTSEGEKWKKHRTIAEPVFSPAQMASMLPAMARLSDEFMQGVRSQNSEVMDLNKLALSLTQNLVTELLFGSKVTQKRDLSAAWDAINAELVSRWWNLAKVSGALLGIKDAEFVEAKKLLDDFVFEMISAKKTVGEDGTDLVSAFVRAQKTSQLNDKHIRDEVLTFFLSAYESTAMGLCWALYFVGGNPDLCEDLYQEISSQPPGGLASAALADKFPLLRATVEETLRLKPPVWGLSRSALADDKIGGFDVPQGSVVLVSPYVTHRNPAYWKEPAVFRPKRFLDEKPAPNTYFPFGLGERGCIGARLAVSKLMIMLASFVSHFKIELVDGESVEEKALLTLKPSPSVRARLVARSE